jgi:hypothetical protein
MEDVEILLFVGCIRITNFHSRKTEAFFIEYIQYLVVIDLSLQDPF